MLRLMLLLIWVDDTSLNWSWILGVLCSTLGIIGIPSFCSFKASCLRCLVAVNHDGRGGSAPDPLVWDQGSKRKQLKIDIRVNVGLASLPEQPGFLNGPWVQVHGGCINGSDVAAWPHSVSMLCKFSSAEDKDHLGGFFSGGLDPF